METVQKQTGRPRLRPGSREAELHTVAIKLDEPTWEKLQRIAAALDIKPGRFSSDSIIELVRNFDLDAIESQEALPIAKAS